MKKTLAAGLDARLFRFVLVAGLIAIIGIGIAGFLFIRSTLAGYATETAMLSKESKDSADKVAFLKSMDVYLMNNQDDISRAKSVVADSAKYKYQDQFVNEILSFAKASDVKVTNFQFSEAAAAGSTAAAAPPTNATGTAAAPTPAVALPNGSKPTSVNVTIENPVRYRNLLSFVKRIEKNITKMQIANISLSATSEGSKSNVTTNAFDIEVYLRS